MTRLKLPPEQPKSKEKLVYERFADGSALLLDSEGEIVGIEEARPPYLVPLSEPTSKTESAPNSSESKPEAPESLP